MKPGFILTAVLAIATVSLAVYVFLPESGLKGAIDEFEDGDYYDSIVRLNSLIPHAVYDDLEKIHYYRTKALNRLAAETAEDHGEDLETICSSPSDTEKYRKSLARAEKTLEKINSKLGCDLEIRKGSKCVIVSGGRFYEQFRAAYSGSELLQDLEFEELRKAFVTDPADGIDSLIDFALASKNSAYLAESVKMLISAAENPEISTAQRSDALFEIFSRFAAAYPSSAEKNRMRISTGDNVNLRDSPDLNGNAIGRIKLGELLLETGKSMDKAQIGEHREYWYRVRSLSGAGGWVFGKFLAPFNPPPSRGDSSGEIWQMEEKFQSWQNSGTPENWQHIENAETSAVSFSRLRDASIVKLKSPAGKISGLYRAFPLGEKFTVEIRARYIAGDALTLVSPVTGRFNSFPLSLRDERLEICGRNIPFNTSGWHVYRIECPDGRYARLLIDGEVISARIEPVKVKSRRGIFVLLSGKGENSEAEIEYINAK